jgi:drug/metabolite transporter (DMT)-like permease
LGAADSSSALQEPRGSIAGRPVSPARGRALVVAAAVCWGMSAALARFVFHARQVPPLTVVELRLLIAVILLGTYLAWRQPAKLRISARDLPYFLLLGLFGVAAIQGSYYYAISTLGVGLAILLQYLAPALIVLFDITRGAHVRPHLLIAVAIAALGAALVVGNIHHGSIHARPLDWAIGFGSAFVFAFYIVASKHGLERYAPETVVIYTFAIAGIFWAIVTPPWKIIAAGYSPSLWLMFLALGVFSTLVPFLLFYAGLRSMRPSEVGIIATLEPVVAVLASAFFLSEGLSVLQWLGAALVLASAALSSVEARDSLPSRS